MLQDKYTDKVSEIIQSRLEVFNIQNTVTLQDFLGKDDNYPIADNNWLRIPDVVCVFVDIRNSTGLSATLQDKYTASVYELFTGTAVRIFNSFEASYIDVKGDGVFALFDKRKVHHALAGAITFKTFAVETFMKLVTEKVAEKVDIGFHLGIDQKTVLVKQVGLKDKEGFATRKNEVWAGKPINMSAKLASLSRDGQLLVSDRFFLNLSKSDLIHKSCGCSKGMEEIDPDGTFKEKPLWREFKMPEKNTFDFNKIWCLTNTWCSVHGKEWCHKITELDNNK